MKLQITRKRLLKNSLTRIIHKQKTPANAGVFTTI